MYPRVSILVFLIFAFAACNTGDGDELILLPTLANPVAVQTSIVKTQNAPPPGFETIAFNPIDYNRDQLPGWYFKLTVNFEGQYTETGEDADSSLIMEVWENSVLRSRRVLLRFVGDALSGGNSRLEAVRFENDYYLLNSNGICTKNSDPAQEIATLNAGRIVGGVTLALPTGIAAEVNAYDGYQYGFGVENLVINIFQQDPSAVDVTGGEIWVLPEFNVVGRFGVSMTVHNARILFGERPVTGSLKYQYDLYDIGEESNIALPNGC